MPWKCSWHDLSDPMRPMCKIPHFSLKPFRGESHTSLFFFFFLTWTILKQPEQLFCQMFFNLGFLYSSLVTQLRLSVLDKSIS